MRRYGHSLLATALVAGIAFATAPAFAQGTTDQTTMDQGTGGPEVPLNTRIDRIKSATDQAMSEAAKLLQQGQPVKARQTLEAAEANLLSARQFDISQAVSIDQEFGTDIATMQAAINAIWKHEPKIALGTLHSKVAPAASGPVVTLHSLTPPSS